MLQLANQTKTNLSRLQSCLRPFLLASQEQHLTNGCWKPFFNSIKMEIGWRQSFKFLGLGLRFQT